jgi:hypothetical protein
MLVSPHARAARGSPLGFPTELAGYRGSAMCWGTYDRSGAILLGISVGVLVQLLQLNMIMMITEKEHSRIKALDERPKASSRENAYPCQFCNPASPASGFRPLRRRLVLRRLWCRCRQHLAMPHLYVPHRARP